MGLDINLRRIRRLRVTVAAADAAANAAPPVEVVPSPRDVWEAAEADKLAPWSQKSSERATSVGGTAVPSAAIVSGRSMLARSSSVGCGPVMTADDDDDEDLEPSDEDGDYDDDEDDVWARSRARLPQSRNRSAVARTASDVTGAFPASGSGFAATVAASSAGAEFRTLERAHSGDDPAPAPVRRPALSAFPRSHSLAAPGARNKQVGRVPGSGGAGGSKPTSSGGSRLLRRGVSEREPGGGSSNRAQGSGGGGGGASGMEEWSWMRQNSLRGSAASRAEGAAAAADWVRQNSLGGTRTSRLERSSSSSLDKDGGEEGDGGDSSGEELAGNGDEQSAGTAGPAGPAGWGRQQSLQHNLRGRFNQSHSVRAGSDAAGGGEDATEWGRQYSLRGVGQGPGGSMVERRRVPRLHVRPVASVVASSIRNPMQMAALSGSGGSGGGGGGGGAPAAMAFPRSQSLHPVRRSVGGSGDWGAARAAFAGPGSDEEEEADGEARRAGAGWEGGARRPGGRRTVGGVGGGGNDAEPRQWEGGAVEGAGEGEAVVFERTSTAPTGELHAARYRMMERESLRAMYRADRARRRMEAGSGGAGSTDFGRGGGGGGGGWSGSDRERGGGGRAGAASHLRSHSLLAGGDDEGSDGAGGAGGSAGVAGAQRGNHPYPAVGTSLPPSARRPAPSRHHAEAAHAPGGPPQGYRDPSASAAASGAGAGGRGHRVSLSLGDMEHAGEHEGAGAGGGGGGAPLADAGAGVGGGGDGAPTWPCLPEVLANRAAHAHGHVPAYPHKIPQSYSQGSVGGSPARSRANRSGGGYGGNNSGGESGGEEAGGGSSRRGGEVRGSEVGGAYTNRLGSGSSMSSINSALWADEGRTSSNGERELGFGAGSRSVGGGGGSGGSNHGCVSRQLHACSDDRPRSLEKKACASFNQDG
ncbi:unnamed protein product [Closterium sp. NIES-64]|nr:unnamed protein product [Closterium sp. NIES-64]